jgi:hypothetical protein
VLLTFYLDLPFEELRSGFCGGDDVHGADSDPLGASIPLTDNLSYPGVPPVHLRVPGAGSRFVSLWISKPGLHEDTRWRLQS